MADEAQHESRMAKGRGALAHHGNKTRQIASGEQGVRVMQPKVETDLEWDDWYSELQDVARRHGESVRDVDAWMPEWEQNKTPGEAFYEEYPEHAPKAQASAKQHSVPCRECPFRRKSAPGWLGASQPGEFLQLADSAHRTPCHMHVDYESSTWQRDAQAAPQCVGRSVFAANRCKRMEGGLLKADPDRDAVFSRPHEFVAHHARREPSELEGMMVYDLYEIKKPA